MKVGSSGSGGWTEAEWLALDGRARQAVYRAQSDAGARAAVVPFARKVMRAFSSNFYVVTRFLPAPERADVEVLYANVRYPDEVVDSFALPPEEMRGRLDRWGRFYEESLCAPSVRSAIDAGLPVLLAAFGDFVRRSGAPSAYYRSFLEAMRADIEPGPFATLQELVDGYVYGSAVVVGYLLTHAFGAMRASEPQRALAAARALGIALQLTNFGRDVGEDLGRGRVYIPATLLQQVGLDYEAAFEPANGPKLREAARLLALEARRLYDQASRDLDAFPPHSLPAIDACLSTFRLLNEQVVASPRGIEHRETLPLMSKLAPLPPSKYWRIPVAYLTEWRP